MPIILQPDEKVILNSGVNPVVPVLRALVPIVLIALLAFLIKEYPDRLMRGVLGVVSTLLALLDERAPMLLNATLQSSYYQMSYLVTLILAGLTMLRLLIGGLSSLGGLRTQYILTDQRLLVCEGLIFRKTQIAPYRQVTVVEVAGMPFMPPSLRVYLRSGQKLRLRWVRDAYRFQQAFNALIEEKQALPTFSEKL